MNRSDLRARGAELRKRLGIASSRTASAIGFEAFLDESVYGAIWGRGALSIEDRMVCTLAALGTLARDAELPAMIESALEIGLEPRAIVEVFAHSGLYGGFSATASAMAHAEQIFSRRGIELPEEAPRSEELEVLTEKGADFIAELHGERGTQGYASPDNPVTGELYGLAIQYLYGELWLRPGLDRRRRLLCALVAFTVLGLEGQLRKFSLSALRVGFTREEVIETLIQTAPYGGYPRALNALAAFGDAAGDAD